MLRRRLLMIPALALALAPALTACGSDDGDDGFPGDGATRSGLDAVTITGDVGTAPSVKWKAQMSAGAVKTDVLTEGDGEKLADGDSAMAQIWIGNGFTKEKAFSTYNEKRAELLTNNDQLADFLTGIKDEPIGSRIAVTGSADKVFGAAGNSQLGIGNKDAVLIVIDLVSPVLSGPDPDGATSPDPSWMPKLQSDADGNPTGFDFTGTPQPTADLRRVQLIKGTGARVKKGQTIAVNYLGEAFGGTTPFDQNYTGDKAVPTAFGIGTGQVIKGWDQGLVGVPIGSRVVLEVPADLGYGAAGQPDSGIPANATLVFVIDVLGAA